MKHLKKELKDALKAYFTKKYNDEELAEDDMEYVNINVTNEDEYVRVNLGAEVDYDTLDEMCDLLNPIIQKYDEDAYFDMEDAGLAVAFIRGQASVEDCGVKDGINMFTNEGKIDGIIEKISAREMFETARDSQTVGLYISQDKKYLALVQVEGYYMGDTEDWEYDEEDGYEVSFAITNATEKLDLRNVDVVNGLGYESKGIVPENVAIEGIDAVLKEFNNFSLNSTDIEDCGVKDETQHLTFSEVSNIFFKHNEENEVKSQFEDENPLYAVAVISEDSFADPYSLEERSYRFRSDNKAFLSNMIGNSIFATSLDGSDQGVRLDRYMHGDSGWIWKIDYCYIENK